MLSPGVLFPAGYLLLYLSTNIYLNAEFKNNLSKSVNKATGNTWHISIKSMKSGWVLNSVTLNHIELTKTKAHGKIESADNSAITINNLEIPVPNLEKLLFSSADRTLSTNTVCEKILNDQHFNH